MEKFDDQGLVLSARAHGESGAVVSLLTPNHGRCAGYVRGAQGSKMRGTLEMGNLVDAQWSARTQGALGTFTLELSQNHAARFMSDPLKLAALQSACALCEAALPEREGHAGLFHGLVTLLETLDTDIWDAAYVMWEIAFLRELGFSLDLKTCAGGGDPATLAYVSPKTGRAVSSAMGEPYKDRLLPLPKFLVGQNGSCEPEDILKGLNLSEYFLTHWVFAHHTHGVPEARRIFGERIRLRFESVICNTERHGARHHTH